MAKKSRKETAGKAEFSLEEQLERYRKAGQIAAKVREEIARPMIKPGKKILDICETIEQAVRDNGGDLAFPCNISVNEIAAHYTSPLKDETVINDGDLVKVDFGVHVDGFIADQAFSVAFNPEHEPLVNAAKEACETALSMVKAGVRSNAIGKVVEGVIKKAGYKSVRELSGHELNQYNLHAGMNIPNIALPTGKALEAGQVFAIETFASNGTGHVHDRPYAYIFKIEPNVRAPLRFSGSRKAIGAIKRNFHTLPFAERWLAKYIGPAMIPMAIRELVRRGLLYPYSPLADQKGSFIAQEEHTVIVTGDGGEVTTRYKQ
ncbi:MAG: type II methionyl aminopeptidase [Candidatus Ranarchaeia archaeon]